ncbi:MAG: ABC transporter substrate-binding protein [Thaumarchaeota archaeon]|nr:ABC transporter substrate-binding protein [Nitrososphaerota archaeon]
MRTAIARVALVVIIIVIIIIAGAAAIYAANISKGSTATGTSSVSTSPSTSVSSASSITSASSSSISTSSNGAGTSSTSGASNNATLVLDDTFWPASDFNQLWSFGGVPYPGWAEYSVYQTLVNVNESAEYNSGNIQYLPGLAQNWTVSSDAKTYTFNLKNGIMFSNGDPLNAYQIWAQMYMIYFVTGNSSSWLDSYNVFDMSTANFGQATLSVLNQSGLASPSQAALKIMENSSWPIYATGPTQIVFKLVHPFQYFLGLMLVYAGLIFDSQYVLEHGGPGSASAINVFFNTNPIPGTGPYEFSHVAEQSYALFTQNPSYWGSNLTAQQIQANPFLDPGHVKNIIVYYKADDVARFTDVSTGKAQIAVITSSDWNSVISNPTKYQYFQVPKYSALEALFSLNTRLYPTNITDVRLAIVHAINYTDLISKAFGGKGQELIAPEYPIYGQFYNLPGFQPYQYNLTLAKQYLTSANVKSPVSITFFGSSTTDWQGIAAQVMQADLAQIGITLTINDVPYAQCQTYQGAYSFNLKLNTSSSYNIELPGCGPWGPSELTPADAFTDFASNRSTLGNTAIYSNSIVENGINAFFNSQNTTDIQSLMKQAEIQLYNDAPLITVGLGLWNVDGSLVWQKGSIGTFLVDPLTTGTDTMPILNTITLG